MDNEAAAHQTDEKKSEDPYSTADIDPHIEAFEHDDATGRHSKTFLASPESYDAAAEHSRRPDPATSSPVKLPTAKLGCDGHDDWETQEEQTTAADVYCHTAGQQENFFTSQSDASFHELERTSAKNCRVIASSLALLNDQLHKGEPSPLREQQPCEEEFEAKQIGRAELSEEAVRRQEGTSINMSHVQSAGGKDDQWREEVIDLANLQDQRQDHVDYGHKVGSQSVATPDEGIGLDSFASTLRTGEKGSMEFMHAGVLSKYDQHEKHDMPPCETQPTDDNGNHVPIQEFSEIATALKNEADLFHLDDHVKATISTIGGSVSNEKRPDIGTFTPAKSTDIVKNDESSEDDEIDYVIKSISLDAQPDIISTEKNVEYSPVHAMHGVCMNLPLLGTSYHSGHSAHREENFDVQLTENAVHNTGSEEWKNCVKTGTSNVIAGFFDGMPVLQNIAGADSQEPNAANIAQPGSKPPQNLTGDEPQILCDIVDPGDEIYSCRIMTPETDKVIEEFSEKLFASATPDIISTSEHHTTDPHSSENSHDEIQSHATKHACAQIPSHHPPQGDPFVEELHVQGDLMGTMHGPHFDSSPIEVKDPSQPGHIDEAIHAADLSGHSPLKNDLLEAQIEALACNMKTSHANTDLTPLMGKHLTSETHAAMNLIQPEVDSQEFSPQIDQKTHWESDHHAQHHENFIMKEANFSQNIDKSPLHHENFLPEFAVDPGKLTNQNMASGIHEFISGAQFSHDPLPPLPDVPHDELLPKDDVEIVEYEPVTGLESKFGPVPRFKIEAENPLVEPAPELEGSENALDSAPTYEFTEVQHHMAESTSATVPRTPSTSLNDFSTGETNDEQKSPVNFHVPSAASDLSHAILEKVGHAAMPACEKHAPAEFISSVEEYSKKLAPCATEMPIHRNEGSGLEVECQSHAEHILPDLEVALSKLMAHDEHIEHVEISHENSHEKHDLAHSQKVHTQPHPLTLNLQEDNLVAVSLKQKTAEKLDTTKKIETKKPSSDQKQAKTALSPKTRDLRGTPEKAKVGKVLTETPVKKTPPARPSTADVHKPLTSEKFAPRKGPATPTEAPKRPVVARSNAPPIGPKQPSPPTVQPKAAKAVVEVKTAPSGSNRRTQSHSPSRPNETPEKPGNLAQRSTAENRPRASDLFTERKKEREEMMRKKKAAMNEKQLVEKEQRRKDAEMAFQNWLQRKELERRRTRSTGRPTQILTQAKEVNVKKQKQDEAQVAFQSWLGKKAQDQSKPQPQPINGHSVDKTTSQN